MPTYDYAILGGGSAGCILANRLSANPDCTVVLLEAGSWVDDPDMRLPERWPLNYGRSYDWAYWTMPQAGLGGRRLDWPRGKGFGGSSLLHAMAHMRGCREDFDAWVATTGDSGWGWDALLPYFRQMEDFAGGESLVHGIDGPLAVMRPGSDLLNPVVNDYIAGWQELGVPLIADHNGGQMLGVTANSLTISQGQRVTVADAYLTPIMDRPNLEVIGDATVDRLEVQGRSVSGIAYSVAGRAERLTANRIVLALGALASPMLLMRSGIGDPGELTAVGVTPIVESCEVGKNLQDHLLAGNVYRSTKPVPPTRLQVSESMTYLKPSDITATTGAPDVVVGCAAALATSSELTARVQHLIPGQGYTLFCGVTRPTSRGQLRLSGPAADDEPLIDPNYLDTTRDRENFVAALHLAREVGRSHALESWMAEEILPGPTVQSAEEMLDFIRQAAITHHHPVSTLRMGSDETAPVASDLAFRGLDNLTVADASVIPTIVSGPVHAAVLAIAERHADQLLARH